MKKNIIAQAFSPFVYKAEGMRFFLSLVSRKVSRKYVTNP